MVNLVQSKLAVQFALVILMTGYVHCVLDCVEVSRIENALERQPFTPDGCDDPNCICHGATLVDEVCEDRIDINGCTSECRFVGLRERPSVVFPISGMLAGTSPSLCVMQQSFQL